MENKTKTVATLKKEVLDYELELENSYKNLGNKLFTDASNPTMDKSTIEKDELMAWQKLRDEREHLSESILNIKKNSERLSELHNFEKEVSTANKSTIKKIEALKPKFLRALYKDFAANCPTVFAPVIDEIHKNEAEIDNLNAQLKELENAKKEAKFFSKVSFVPKISSIKKKISKNENAISDLLNKNVTDIQDNQEIKNLYNFEAFTDEMKTQFEELSTLCASMNDSEKRLEMLNEEREFVTKSLSELGAENRSNKKLSSLNEDIKKLDVQIEAMLKTAGTKFVDEFYDEEGQSLTGEDFTNEELKDYSEFLRRTSFHRRKKAKAKYNIEYCEVREQINNENQKIENAERNIKNAEKAIEDAKVKIKEAEKNKQNAEDELVNLNLKADKLKEKFSGEDTEADVQAENNTKAEDDE